MFFTARIFNSHSKLIEQQIEQQIDEANLQEKEQLLKEKTDTTTTIPLL